LVEHNRGNLQAISLLAWKDIIRLLQLTFKKLSYKHIYHEHNKSADQLSKAALQKKSKYHNIQSLDRWSWGPSSLSNTFLRSSPLTSTDFYDLKVGVHSWPLNFISEEYLFASFSSALASYFVLTISFLWTFPLCSSRDRYRRKFFSYNNFLYSCDCKRSDLRIHYILI
jgi:hypothetical protein